MLILASKSATVLIILILAILAFGLANVFAAMTGDILIPTVQGDPTTTNNVTDDFTDNYSEVSQSSSSSNYKSSSSGNNYINNHSNDNSNNNHGGSGEPRK